MNHFIHNTTEECSRFFIDRFKFYKKISCDIIDSHHFLNAAIRYGHVTVLRQL